MNRGGELEREWPNTPNSGQSKRSEFSQNSPFLFLFEHFPVFDKNKKCLKFSVLGDLAPISQSSYTSTGTPIFQSPIYGNSPSTWSLPVIQKKTIQTFNFTNKTCWCAFSTSSKRTTLYGTPETSVSSMPSPCPTIPDRPDQPRDRVRLHGVTGVGPDGVVPPLRRPVFPGPHRHEDPTRLPVALEPRPAPQRPWPSRHAQQPTCAVHPLGVGAESAPFSKGYQTGILDRRPDDPRSTSA